MSEDANLVRRIERVTSEIEPRLTERDIDYVVQGTHRKVRQKARRRVVVRAGVAGGALCLGALVVARLFVAPSPRVAEPITRSTNVPGASATPTPANLPVDPASQILRLHDGSFATPLEPGSVLTAIDDGPDRVTLDLTRGKARFDVVPSQRRTFSVRVGDVTVTVLGTVFTVERVADRVGVSVERGTVRVDWTSGTRQLAVGQSGWFPPLPGTASEPAHRPAVLTQKARARRPVAFAQEESPATSAPEPTAPDPTAPAVDPVNTSVSDMLAAADAARLNGQPAEGAAILRRVLREHPTDQRAPLAAFTLGRLLLIELGHPREAALAFAQVRTLTPGTPFAEDALAREAEAWMKANELVTARVRAREYLRLYPRGRRAEFVQSLIGIE